MIAIVAANAVVVAVDEDQVVGICARLSFFHRYLGDRRQTRDRCQVVSLWF